MENFNPKYIYSSYKSDVFTFGMMILHIAISTPCDTVYNWDNCTIKELEL